MPIALVLNDRPDELDVIDSALHSVGCATRCATSVEEVELLGDVKFDILVSTLCLGGNGSGWAGLRGWKQHHPSTPVIGIAPEDDGRPFDEAGRRGLDECIQRPLDRQRLTTAIRRHLRNGKQNGRRPDRPDEAAGQEQPAIAGMISGSAAMQSVFEQAQRVASTTSTVFITGETGTGKDLLAQGIHQLSSRRKAPFVAVNVAAIPDSLTESELFGHVKGAFTDAATDRIGRFEAADGGTLFIDEIGDLRLESQAKLLRVLETHTINRVGCNRDIPIDVRVVAATSRNVNQLLAKSRFREDLYYRLSVVCIHIPPLRDRPEDIPLLVKHFLSEVVARNGQSVRHVDPELMSFFENAPWPGNVRQLKNCLESMVVMSGESTLTTEQLPAAVRRTPRSASMPPRLELGGLRLRELENTAIRQTLVQCKGNRTHAARALGISVRTLQRKLKRHGLVSDTSLAGC